MFSPAHRLLKVCGGGELLGYGLAHGKAILGTWWFFGGVWWWKFHSFTIWLWLTWLENPSHGGFSGKIIHKWAMASMAMLNNQRVNWVHNQFIINVKNKDWRLSYQLIIRRPRQTQGGARQGIRHLTLVGLLLLVLLLLLLLLLPLLLLLLLLLLLRRLRLRLLLLLRRRVSKKLSGCWFLALEAGWWHGRSSSSAGTARAAAAASAEDSTSSVQLQLPPSFTAMVFPCPGPTFLQQPAGS